MAGVVFDWPVGNPGTWRQTITDPQLDLLRDLRPVWRVYVGNVRRFHMQTFAQQRDPLTRQKWTPLTPEYAKRKAGLLAKLAKAKKAVQRKVSKPKRPADPFGRFARAFRTAQATKPAGAAQQASDRKGARGSAKAGGAILVLSGAMKAAATRPNAPGQVALAEPRQLTFGVRLGVIYPLAHQTTERLRKDGKPRKRRWLGLPMPEAGVQLIGVVRGVFIAKAGGKVAIGQRGRIPQAEG